MFGAALAALALTGPGHRVPPAVPAWLMPKLHWHTAHGGQGDPTAPVKLGDTWSVWRSHPAPNYSGFRC